MGKEKVPVSAPVSWGCPSQLSLCGDLAVTWLSHHCSSALMSDVGANAACGVCGAAETPYCSLGSSLPSFLVTAVVSISF